MKFLILQRINPQVTVETLAKLTPLHMKYMDEMRAKGRIESYYHMIGQQGDMVIVKVDSDEELTRFVGDDPLFFHSHREVYPLTTLETHRKHLMELLKK